jgi:hypothetical protein
MLNIATYSYTCSYTSIHVDWVRHIEYHIGVLVIILSFIFTCPAPYNKYKLFSIQRDHTLIVSDHIFLHHGIYFPFTILIHASSILCFINLHMHVLIFLYVTFMQIISNLCYLSFIKYNITFSHTLCQKHEAITLSYFTLHWLFYLTFRDYYSVLMWHKMR